MAVNINIPSQVKTYANLAAFPATGALKTIYIAEDTNKTYRWTGSIYTEISASAAMTWGAIGGTLSNQTDLQSALDAKVPTSRTLTINGVTQDLSANRTFTISTGITIGSTAIASGVVGRILFEGAGNVVQESSSLFWDNTNVRLGVGTSTPITAVEVKKTGSDSWITASRGTNTFHAGFLFNPSGSWTASNVLWNFGLYANTNDLRYWTYNGSTDTNVLNLFGSTANVGIGTTTDAGFKLDVNGTARVQNTTTITKGASNYITFEPSANGTSPFLDMFFSGQVSTRISLGTTSSTRVFLFRDLGTALGMGIDCGAIFSNSNAILIGGTEQKVQIAGTTNNYLQFTQAGTSNRGTIGYAAGQSYMQIRVNGATDLATGTLSTAFFSTGNVGINTTTDAGFRLDVNGTARVQSTTTIGTSAFPFGSNLLTLISDQGSFSMRVGGGGQLQCSAGITATTLQSNDFVQCVRVLVGSSARLNGGTTDWLSITNWAQSSLGSGNVSANLATFGTAYATINASAQVEISSTTKGFLPPRMTTTQRNAIASPAAGLMVYDTTLNVITYYNGTMWI